MRSSFRLALLAIGAGPLVLFAQDAVQDELKRMQGAWTLSAREVEGVKSTDDEVQELLIRLEIKGNTVRFKSLGGKDWHESTLKIDPSATPKALDVIHQGADKQKKPLLAIYKLENDLWTVCNSTETRPSQFTAKKGSGQVLLVFKRAAEPKSK